MGGNGEKWGNMGGNGGKWGLCCAYVSPLTEGGDLPAPLVFSLSVRSYLACYAPIAGL